MPPRLPPRSPSQASFTSSLSESADHGSHIRHNTIHLTPPSNQNHPYAYSQGLDDPRSSSTQSLRPIESAGPDRRVLLIVYIHGFMGTETSFRSFPAHLHNLLTMTLAETHVVHSKIYPRYQSRKNISFARDAFSNWLVPHESDKTDVVLVGHSLGGILGAEVVLIPSHTPGSQNALQHRILGLIAFDTPFLGMHPGVVSTGIASLFRGSPDSTEPAASSSETWRPLDTTSSDPNFNPAYTNDVNLPVRNNKWERAWYFWNKHYGEVRKAAQSYVKSHLEFGGCLADYPGLRRRYDSVRSLEDINELERRTNAEGRYVHRVRFVNYYTASTGRIKELKTPIEDGHTTKETEMQMLKPIAGGTLSPGLSNSSTPRLSLEEHGEDAIVDKTENLEIDDDSIDQEPLQSVDPLPLEHNTDNDSKVTSIYDDLPPIPPDPEPPAELDTTRFTDPDALRLAQKEHARQSKVYEKAKRDREKSIRDRDKVIAKRQRQVEKEEQQKERLIAEEEDRRRKEQLKRQSTLNPEQEDMQTRASSSIDTAANKKKRDRKFCSLPAKDRDGKRDPTWVRVFMEGMDEVVAHTSLFFVSDAYERLIGDTAERIEDWINEDASMKRMLSEQG